MKLSPMATAAVGSAALLGASPEGAAVAGAAGRTSTAANIPASRARMAPPQQIDGSPSHHDRETTVNGDIFRGTGID
jgi:hypothetical protein